MPPTEGHRWLPLRPASQKKLAHTPYGGVLRNPDFKDNQTMSSWAHSAQAHFSLFENIERGELKRYDFGSSYDGIWNRMYVRYNINLMAIRGSYVAKNPIWTDKYRLRKLSGDEFLFTVSIPKELDMPSLIATRSLAAHFSFSKTRDDMLKTDILDRYRALANELYCPLHSQRSRIGGTNGTHHTEDHKKGGGHRKGNHQNG